MRKPMHIPKGTETEAVHFAKLVTIVIHCNQKEFKLTTALVPHEWTKGRLTYTSQTFQACSE